MDVEMVTKSVDSKLSDQTLRFVKMQATGNDFILTTRDWVRESQTTLTLSDLARVLCDRHYGVGGDGLICLQPLTTGDSDSLRSGSSLEMLFLNPDGSHSRMCGNGARCFSRFAWSLGWKCPLLFRVNDNLYESHFSEESPEIVTVFFQESVSVQPLDIQAILKNSTRFMELLKKLDLSLFSGYRVKPGTDNVVLMMSSEISFLSAKYPHSSDWKNQLREVAEEVRFDPAFAPDGVNVNFVRKVGVNCLELVTYERGVDNFTESCGTGTIAAALTFLSETQQKDTQSGVDPTGIGSSGVNSSGSTFTTIVLNTNGGTLHVQCESTNLYYHSAQKPDPHSEKHSTESLSREQAESSSYKRISLTGPARFVAEGTLILPS